MPTPQRYSFTRFLSAKRSVDDRALNGQVWQQLLSLLRTAAAARPLHILELGAGIGSMAERLICANVLTEGTYTAIDVNPDAVAQGRDEARRWAEASGFQYHINPTGGRLQRDRLDITLHLETVDLFDFIAEPQGQRAWDLLVAHALLDLLDIPTALPALLSVLSPGGLFYFPITFDGASILEPAIDPTYDAHIESLYHATMDQRVVRGRPSGDSRTGRHLFGHLRALGANILGAGSSDWVVFAGPNGYPDDEAYFLHDIIHTIHTALAQHPELDPDRFARWVHQRHTQIEDEILVYVAHQLDVLGQVPIHAPVT
jgi:SAM-dependent methyltransferase